jgi:hypothetical protein
MLSKLVEAVSARVTDVGRAAWVLDVPADALQGAVRSILTIYFSLKDDQLRTN